MALTELKTEPLWDLFASLVFPRTPVDPARATISPLLQQQLDIYRNEAVCSSIAFHCSFIRIRYWKRSLKVTILHKVIDLLIMYTSNREWWTIRLLGFFAKHIIPQWHKWIRKLIKKYSIMHFFITVSSWLRKELPGASRLTVSETWMNPQVPFFFKFSFSLRWCSN